MADNRISEIIQNQLPSFFMEEGSNLPLFLTKYFEFLESYQIEYTDLILDEFNLVLEDDNNSYYIHGTALDTGVMYQESHGHIGPIDIGLQTGYFFPVYGNKPAAIAASDNPEIVYTVEFEEWAGLKFYMPQKGGESGINFGVFENDPPTTELTQYTATGKFVLESTAEIEGVLVAPYDEALVESDRDPTTATFQLGESVVGSDSGVEAIVTGTQNHGVFPAGKYQSSDITSDNYKTDPHLLFARPTNGKAFLHGETITGRRSRAKAYVGKTDKDITRNPLRASADFDLVNDIDETDNLFLERFRDDFLTNIPMDSIGDLRQAIKTAREIYRSRGTEDSFLWLWRTVYGSEQLSFIYPKERLLRPSDGTWKSLKSIKVYTGTSLNPDDFNSKIIKGEQSQATATVDNSISYFEGTTGITELFLTDYTKGYDIRFDTYSDFKADETIATIEAYVDMELMSSNNSSDAVYAMDFPTGSSRGTCIAVIGEVDIISNGTGYKVNDTLVFTNSPGTGAVARVNATANGAIDEIIIDDGGNGYIGGEALVVQSAGTGGSGHTGAVRGVIPTGMYRTSNTLISAAISTAEGGTAESAILLNQPSFSIEQEGVRYPENINTHFSSSNTITFVAEVTNQDTAEGGANILLEEGLGQILIDSTDGSADAGDNILLHTEAFEDDMQPGYYVYDSKTGAKGTIAGPSVNNSSFVYALESPQAPNFVEGSYGSLYYSANGSAVPGKSNLFTISTIQPASYFETLDADTGLPVNQLGDGFTDIFDYYGGTSYTYTKFGSISNTQVITTGIDYIKGPTYEAKNEGTLGLEQWRFEDPITGKNTGRLTYLNFRENIYGKYRFGESVIGVTSGAKGKVILPYVNTSSNSTFSTMKVLPEETIFSLEDENVLLNNVGDFENGSISGLSASTYKRTEVDTGNHTLSLESAAPISGSYSGKMAVNDQLDIYIGLRSLDSETGEAYANTIIPGDQYQAKISFKTSASLRFVELRYGHSDTDANYEPSGVNVGLTESVVYTHPETTNADQVYTFEGKFVASSDRYHAVYLFANTQLSSSYDLHIDNISIANISARGKLQFEGFNTADDIDSFMIMEPSEFQAGEVLISAKGARMANLATSNVTSLETQSGYGNNAILKAGALKTGAIKSIAISSAGINYSLTPDVSAPDGDNNATFLARRTALTEYPGKFQDQLGMVSNIIRIQDSYYYQDFSYVLRSDIQINEFRDLVRSFVHPAGWNVFGEIGILLLLNVSVDVGTETVKKLEMFVDRTPEWQTTYGPLTAAQRGDQSNDAIIYNDTINGPYTSIHGNINFDVGIIHNYHVEFLDPRSLGFGATTDDKHFAFHAGRIDWINGLGWDYEKWHRGTMAGQFDGPWPNTNAPWNSNNMAEPGRQEIPHHFAQHDKALLNSSSKIAPWYPNVFVELIIPGHYEGNECTGHSAAGETKEDGDSTTSYNKAIRWDPQHSTNAWGAYAGAQRPADNYWGLGGDGDPDAVRKGGIEYWPEIGILGKYRSPDGTHVMPTISTYYTYGHEEIELLADLWKTNYYLTVLTELEIFNRGFDAGSLCNLPLLTGVSTYINSEVDELQTTFFAGSYDKSISRAITQFPNDDLREITVTVDAGDYQFNGVDINDSNWTVELIKGVTYRFWVLDNTNLTHELKFASILDGSHNGSYTSSMEFPVTRGGTDGNPGAYVDLKVPDFTSQQWLAWETTPEPVLYAYCGVHSDMGGPIKTKDYTVVRSTIEVEEPVIANIIETPQTTKIGTGTQSAVRGQSYVRPREKKLKNPATFVVAGAKVFAGQAVGLRPDGKIERVYEVGNVLFPRVNYVHSLLGMVNEDADVGATVTISDTDSLEERVYDLIPGATYYPNYNNSQDPSANVMASFITTTPPTVTAADSVDRVTLGRAESKDSIKLTFPRWKMFEYQANEAINKGEVVGLMSNGKIQKVFCEADGTAKPQLDGVHSLLGLAKEDIASGSWGEVVTINHSLQMDPFPSGSFNALPADGLTVGTKYYVDYRDATIKEFGTYSNHPDNIIGEAVHSAKGRFSDMLLVTAKLPVHQTYSPQWDTTNIAYPYPTYGTVRTIPNPDEYFLAHAPYDNNDQYGDHIIDSVVISNPTPVNNLEQGSTVLFDDINIILEESDGILLEDGDDLLVEDGTSNATSAIGKFSAENDFLLYEDIINTGTGQSPNAKMNIYSRHDAKYIVGDLTTTTFNIHNRGNKYFPEGILDAVAQHIVLE